MDIDEDDNPLLARQLKRIEGELERADDRPWLEREETPEDRREDRIRIVVIKRGEVVEDYVPENRMRLHHAHLREALMRTMGIKHEGRAAFNARMKNILQLGLFREGLEIIDGLREYRLVDALEFGVVMMLQRAYVPQSVAVDFVHDYRDSLDTYWDRLRVHSRVPFAFTLSMEGFAPTGNEDRSNKRGNRGGRQLDTVKLIPGKRIRPGATLAPTILIDLPDLVDCLCANLVKAGVDEETVKEARLSLPGRRLGYLQQRAIQWSRGPAPAPADADATTAIDTDKANASED